MPAQSFLAFGYPYYEGSKSALIPNMDIEEIIKRVRTGDTTALKKLIETYSPMLRKVCFNPSLIPH